jgi:multiple sugar transport system substrate-binding protein
MIAKIARRQFLRAASAAAVAAALPVERARAAPEISWLMHPVHYQQMGKGELLSRLAKETGIVVKATQMPFPQYREKLTILLRQGASDFDIVGISNTWWDGALNRYMQPLESYMAKKPLIEAKDIIADYLFTVGEHNYAVPFRVGPTILHYRKDLYDKYSLKVPRTFDDYKKNARVIQDGERGAVHGAFIIGEQSFFAVRDWSSYLFSFGGKYLDTADLAKATPTVTTPQAVESLKFFVSLHREGLTPPGTLTATWNTFITLMQQGKLAQGLNWSVYIEPIANKDKSTVWDKVAWAEVPVATGSGLTAGKTGTTGWGLFLPLAGKNKDAAWEVVRWITRPDNDLYMGAHGGGPFRASTLKSKEYAATTRATDVILAATANGVPVWNPSGTLPRASEVIDKSVLELTGALAGKVTPVEACNNIATHIKTIALS